MRICAGMLVGLAVVGGCGEGGGGSGPPRSERNIALVGLSAVLAGPSCAAGGTAIQTGIDEDSDGELDADEVDQTSYVCNGKDGKLVALSLELLNAGDPCEYGGVAIHSGYDENGNGTLDTSEVLQTAPVCNGAPGEQGPPGEQGDPGTPGRNSLVRLDPEPRGPNCVFGGVKVNAGLDDDGNATLSDVEVDSAGYVCHGSRPPFPQLEASVFPSDPGVFLGHALDIEGNTLVSTGLNGSPLYIFEFSLASGWVQVAKLGSAIKDSVGISDNVAVGGARNDDSDVGAAYVFERAAGGWSFAQKLSPTPPVASAQFGRHVAVLGNRIAVESTAGVYVFERTAPGASWQQVTKLTPSTGAPDGPIAMSADMIVFSSYGQTVNGSTNAGAVFVFERNAGGAWAETQKVVPGVIRADAYFGEALDMNGSFLVIGAVQDNEYGTNAGAAYVFERVAGRWAQRNKLSSTDLVAGNLFGESVAVDGDTILVSAILDSDQGFGSGSVYVFERDPNANEWYQRAEFHAPQTGSAIFGSGLAISDTRICVGSRGYDVTAGDENSGAVLVYER